MADKQVGELTAATPLVGSEQLHVVQSGNSRRTTVTDILDTFGKKTAQPVVKTPSGAIGAVEMVEQEITLTGGSTSSTVVIPNQAIVLGVSSRTTVAVTGAPSYGVGFSGEPTKFGGSLGAAAGSTNVGTIGPSAVYADTPIVITATSGSFTGGKVRVVAFFMTLTAPTS